MFKYRNFVSFASEGMTQETGEVQALIQHRFDSSPTLFWKESMNPNLNCGFIDRKNIKVDDDNDLYECRVPSLTVSVPTHQILKQTKKKGMLPRLLIRFGGRAIKFGDDFFKCWPAGGRSKVRSYDVPLLTITTSKACSLHIWNRFLHSSTYNDEPNLDLCGVFSTVFLIG